MSVKKAVSASAAGASAWYPVDSMDAHNGPISLGVGGTFVGTYDVEFTFDDPWKDSDGKAYSSAPTLEAQVHSTLTGQTAAANGQIDGLVTAVRLNFTAYTSGTADLFVGQGSMG